MRNIPIHSLNEIFSPNTNEPINTIVITLAPDHKTWVIPIDDLSYDKNNKYVDESYQSENGEYWCEECQENKE